MHPRRFGGLVNADVLQQAFQADPILESEFGRFPNRFSDRSLSHESHAFPQFALALLALQLQSVDGVLQSLFLLLQPLHLQHLAITEARGLSGFAGAAKRLGGGTETRCPPGVVESSFQQLRSGLEALLFPAELIDVIFRCGHKLIDGWDDFIDERLLRLS